MTDRRVFLLACTLVLGGCGLEPVRGPGSDREPRGFHLGLGFVLRGIDHINAGSDNDLAYVPDAYRREVADCVLDQLPSQWDRKRDPTIAMRYEDAMCAIVDGVRTEPERVAMEEMAYLATLEIDRCARQLVPAQQRVRREA